MLRLRCAGYLALLALVCVALWVDVRPQLKVETDLLALLPVEQRDANAAQALKEVSANLGSRVLFLVGAPQFAEARSAADRFAASLNGSGAFAEVHYDISSSRLLSHDVYTPYLPGLLSARQLRLLRTGQAKALEQQALRNLYAPMPMPSAIPTADDPLGLANEFLLQRLPPAGAALPRDGVLTVSGQDREYVLVTAVINGSAFAGDVQDRALSAIDAAEQAARATAPATRLLRAGLLFHSAAGTRASQHEISLISTVSLAAVAALVLLTFGSLRPLLLTTLSLAAGTAFGLAACWYAFHSVHLLTLVFGSTLIGVAVDYSNYWLHDAFDGFDSWTPERALRNTARGILLGLTTATLGYLALMLAPFPGLRQMALFSAVGLIGAAGCVLCLYPVLARKPRNPSPPILQIVLWLHAGVTLLRRARLPGLLLAALVAAGVLRLQVQDDIRLLQSSPAAVVAEETELRGLLGNAPDSRFFLIRGADTQEVLEHEEALRDELDPLVAGGAIAAYMASSRALPSLKTQREAKQLLEAQVYSPGGILVPLMQQIGFQPAAIAARQRAFAALSSGGLDAETWLQSPSAQPYRTLWLKPAAGSASLVMLSGVRDVGALHRVKAPGVQLVDKVQEISEVLGRYRLIATRLLLLAYASAALLLAWRYGLRRSLPLIAGTLAAAALTLGALGWLESPLTLFNVLALLLVLGIGIDYVIFLQEGIGAGHGPLLAVQLSAVTTLLSFGLLAFSATPFIHGLGLTLLLGIGWAFLFALLGAKLKEQA